jgi:hypothetical protein
MLGARGRHPPFPEENHYWRLTMRSDGRSRTYGWKKWLDDFTTEFRDKILPDAVDPDTQQRVRVTVIDTGIDGSHPYIQSQGWMSHDENAAEPLFCDFVKPDLAPGRHDPIDEDGHGTFIAGILLQLAPSIELSIARIGATRISIEHDDQVDNKIARVRFYYPFQK